MGAMRDALTTLGSAPWRRAPRLLLGRPSVFLAVAGACAVLVTAVAAAPLFVSAAGTAALQKQVEERCAASAGITFQSTQVAATVGAAVTGVARGATDIGVPIATQRPLAPITVRSSTVAEGAPVQLMVRTGALERIEVLDGERGANGLWLADTAAVNLAVGAGDRVLLDDGQASVPFTVAGVYRDIASGPLDNYWCSQSQALGVQTATGDLGPPVALVDDGTLEFLALQLDLGGMAPFTWELPTEVDGLTLERAEDVVQTHEEWFTAIRQRLADEAVDPELVQQRSTLAFMQRRSEAMRTTVAAGSLPVVAAAALAGLAMVGAAASFWFDRRSSEVALLSARGVSPAAIGAKAGLEALPAAVLGGFVGSAIAYLGVRTLGPSSLIERSALVRGALVVAVASFAAVVVLGALPAVRARSQHRERTAVRRALAWMPWEVGLGLVAVIAYRRLGETGAPVASGDETTTVDSLGLSFPLAFLATALVVVARFGVVAARRSPTNLRSASAYLAMRRLRAHTGAAVTLVVASAMAVGVLAYSSALTRSLEATLDAKARVFVGSDLAVRLATVDEPPTTLSDPSTLVYRLQARVGDRRFTVLAVDEATFSAAAFWDETFADRSFDSLLADLRPTSGSTSGSAPAIIVGVPPVAGTALQLDDRDRTEVPVDVVGRISAFPGMDPVRTTIVISQSVIDAEVSRPVRELWVDGDTDRALGELRAEGIGTLFTRQAREVVDQAAFLTVQWTFAFMTALGLVSAAITVGGLAIYLDARRRARALAYAFAQRMGMARRTHRRALLTELSATVSVGCVIGVVIALVAVRLSYERIDPIPRVPPSPLLRLVPATTLGLAAAGLVISWFGAVFAQRRADTDDPSEVLRAGT